MRRKKAARLLLALCLHQESIALTLEPSIKSEVVYRDLSRLYTELNNIRRDRVAFRASFELYVLKSQQLTETMRSEFSAMTGLKWEASKFQGWNVYTAALKKLRNAAVHGYPIVLYDLVLSVYPNVNFALDSDSSDYSLGNKSKFRIVSTRSFTTAPFLRESQSITPSFLSVNKEYISPIKEFYSYEIWLDMMNIKSLYGYEIARVDVIKLLLHSFPVFKKYMSFYKRELKKNLLDSYKSDFFVKDENDRWFINKKYQ
ncbi:hypothetical protein [Reinekea thalattae]|uniref:Uncharacterized protein n=1 Tax=Reinekea thalattae TaxID=2593301 RepID=A0A5C8ZAP1_9GAMM|nr:hypothetical protein [Reinekea thalattae]TXR53966.1 hypothetical protein FME95_05300 [Reinekea thalattae]